VKAKRGSKRPLKPGKGKAKIIYLTRRPPGKSSGGAARLERDTMGELEVPADAYYGVQTARAIENFPISSLRVPRSMIRALGLIKWAAARVNTELGFLDPKIAKPIRQAAQEVIEGRLDDQFPVDIFQTGSGTSSNMNVNEVIANRAAEFLGGARGSKLVHPNDHVNMASPATTSFPPRSISRPWNRSTRR
jgi:fumarate hydratase class II